MGFKRIDVTRSAAEHEAAGLTVDDFLDAGLVELDELDDLLVDWRIGQDERGGWVARSRLYSDAGRGGRYSAATEAGVKLAILVDRLHTNGALSAWDARRVRELVERGAGAAEIVGAGVRVEDLVMSGVVSAGEVAAARARYQVGVRTAADGMGHEWFAVGADDGVDAAAAADGGGYTGATQEEVWVAIVLDVIVLRAAGAP